MDLILAFISAMAGSFAGSTICNYISSVRTWHLIHHIQWNIDQLAVDTALCTATISASPKSTRPQRKLVMIDYLTTILNHFNKNHPLNTTIATCVTTTFWSVSRLGEFTVPTIKSFDSKKHITAENITLEHNHSNHQVRAFKLPFTKLAKENSESTSWAQQPGLADPWDTFENHLCINTPPPEAHIFAYKTNHKKTLTPLIKRKVIECMKTITAANNLPSFEGHGLCIRGTLEYLLRGIPFKVIQSMDC